MTHDFIASHSLMIIEQHLIPKERALPDSLISSARCAALGKMDFNKKDAAGGQTRNEIVWHSSAGRRPDALAGSRSLCSLASKDDDNDQI